MRDWTGLLTLLGPYKAGELKQQVKIMSAKGKNNLGLGLHVVGEDNRDHVDIISELRKDWRVPV